MTRVLPALMFLAGLLFATVVQCAPAAPFSRGVNLTNWFQADSAQQIDFGRYTRKDFEHIRNLGADVIRLPVNLHFMTQGAPDYTLDPLFLDYLDQAVDWAEALDLHLVVDNHTFDPSANTDPAVREVLLAVWPQLASHLRDRSSRVYYEVLNEPHGIADATWNAIQQDVVDAIRAVDDRHTIIVGPANWNSYHNLAEMPTYDDDNLVYTFHFYDPFLFTHQGATWVEPSLDPLSGMPFPYRAADMPPLPDSLRGSWMESAYNDYPNEATLARVREQIAQAAEFAESRDVPLFAGEFGVFMSHSRDADRVEWYREVREQFEAHGIAWTSWDYHHGFGLFENGSAGRYEHDLNVPLLQALGFNVPPQTEPLSSADTTGSVLYDDRAGEGVTLGGGGDGTLDFMALARPAQGARSIRWSGPARYQSVSLDFIPDRDLSFLLTNEYALVLQLRCDAPGTRLDVRLLDTDTGENDHPWRLGTLLEPSDLVCDNQWREIRLPLSQMQEQGAWEAGNWYDPRGDFDIMSVDRLELTFDSDNLSGAELGFDDVRLSRLATDATGLHNTAGLNGVFFDPANPGHGFDFNLTDRGLVVYYYGHTLGGERLWLISEAWPGRPRFGEPVSLAAFEVANGGFGAPGAATTPWGTITLTMADCRNGQALLDGIDGKLDMPLRRLVGVPGVFCNSER